METKRKPVLLYIATRDSIDCRVAHATDLGLGRNLCLKRGLLVPVTNGESPKVYRSFREMGRMMHRTQEAYATLKGTLVDQHPRLKPLLDVTSAFKFRTVIRKAGKLVPFTAPKDSTVGIFTRDEVVAART
jgi:hypothetical protein